MSETEFAFNSPNAIHWDCFDYGIYYGESEPQNVRTTPPLGTSIYYSSSNSGSNSSSITSPQPTNIVNANNNNSSTTTTTQTPNSTAATTIYTSPMRSSSGGCALKRSQSLTEQNILIIANGLDGNLPSALIRFIWSKCTVVICADGGANLLYKAFSDKPDLLEKLIPHYIKGDLDSLSESVSDYYRSKGTSIILDSNQDTTDLQKCMELISELELNSGVRYRNIFIAGGLGGSTSHEISNLNTIFLYPNHKLILFSSSNYAWLLNETHTHIIECKPETKCSLIPLAGKVDQVTTTGLKWNLNKQTLNFGGLISTSNLSINSNLTISTSNPLLFVVDLK